MIRRHRSAFRSAARAIRSVALAATVAATLAAPAAAQSAVAGDDAGEDAPVESDLLETVNRWGFAFNRGLSDHVLEPFARYYTAHVPPPVHRRVKNFFSNLREPATVINAALLGRFSEAGVAGARFAVNTTVGLLGINDEATGMGLPSKPVSLEQVLCEYHLPEGPYVVLPVLGPATLRDAAGRLGTLTAYFYSMGPIYWPYRASDIAIQYVDLRSEIRRVNETALDPYVVQRSAYLMHRRHVCANGAGLPPAPR